MPKEIPNAKLKVAITSLAMGADTTYYCFCSR